MVAPVLPGNRGTGQTALAQTRAAWVNLRVGPSTDYNDIGDIRNNTLVFHYPETRQGDWVFLEQYGKAGWVHTDFIDFEPVDANPPTSPTRPTPYDSNVGIWYWEGDSVQETSIEGVVSNIKRLAPNVTQFLLKTSNGHLWQGRSDDKRALAVDGPEDITRWGEVLERFGMELHAWCVPRGTTDLDEEARIMIETINNPYVKSLNLDIEPSKAWYWAGDAEQARELMLKVRRAIPGGFHIAMTVDPRPWHYESIYPDAWKPFVNSIHPMVYWSTFGVTPDEALTQMYDTWLSYGLPIIPIFQLDAPVDEIAQAHSLATARYGAKAMSWWRYGVGSAVEMRAINLPIPGSPTTEPPPEPPTTNPGYSLEIQITPSDAGFSKGTYTGQEEFRSFVQRMGWPVYFTKTQSQRSKVWSMWTPQLPSSGTYAVEVFIHKPYSRTENARYKIHGVRGESAEVLVAVNQKNNTNGWYRLGVFDFDINLPNSGRVFLNDVTGEDNLTVTFDAVRWQRVVEVTPNPGGGTSGENGVVIVNSVKYCDGFDMPVGNGRDSGSKSGSRVWQSGWRDASPYPEPYLYSSYLGRYTSVHTGADLNWGSGAYADIGQEIYSIASGVVIFANERREWGNLVVIQHDPYIVDGRQVSSRYAHLNSIDVSVGDRVTRGQQIGTLGGTRGRPGLSWVPHLHFDIAPTSTFATNEQDWPPSRYKNGQSVSTMSNDQYNTWINRVQSDIIRTYYDPRGFIAEHRPNR